MAHLEGNLVVKVVCTGWIHQRDEGGGGKRSLQGNRVVKVLSIPAYIREMTGSSSRREEDLVRCWLSVFIFAQRVVLGDDPRRNEQGISSWSRSKLESNEPCPRLFQ